jgi:hypothetical protein
MSLACPFASDWTIRWRRCSTCSPQLHDDHDVPAAGDGGGDSDQPGTQPPLDVIVTADCMHTQRSHATYLRRRGGDYVFMAKDNQPTLLGRVKALPWSDMPVAHEQDNTGQAEASLRGG